MKPDAEWETELDELIRDRKPIVIIINFVKDLLRSHDAELGKKIKQRKMKYEHDDTAIIESCKRGYNDALSDIQSLLKKEEHDK